MLVALGAWLVAGTLVGGLLLLRHMMALPVPAGTDPVLQRAIAAALPETGRWRAVHVMYRSCECSQLTIRHLTSSTRPPELDELILMVDDDGRPDPMDAGLRAHGFVVRVVTPAVLHAVFHVDAAPLLVIARPDHALAYVGGYGRSKRSPRYEDVSIVGDLRDRAAGRRPLPVFGCATSEQLAQRMDPLGLRRW